MINEASFTGTARLILVLLAIWLVVRWWMRRSASAGPAPHRGGRRPPGEVRIEDLRRDGGEKPQRGHVIDADFEEIK
ncbi:MAG: hypothetical protein JNM49_03185 [Flavobacteriales bacterium]|jgi:hypothetical protein|nr:hypothetical protein [Flavobacteriales bacterium]